MPKVKLRKEKGPEVVAGSDAAHYPSVYIPASPEILKVLEIDQEVEVTLKGKVTSLSVSHARAEFNMEVYEVEAYPTKKNEYEKLDEETDSDSED